MFQRKPRHHVPFVRRCDSCPGIAVGTITFITDDGEISFAACPACATDALVHPAPGVRLRFRSTGTRAEVSRGLLGGAA